MVKRALGILTLLGLLASPCMADDPTATVTVNSTPDGAAVAIDSSPAGHTPCTLRLAPGQHELKLEDGDNYQPDDEPLTVQAGDTRTVDVTLKRTALSYYTEAVTHLSKGHNQAALDLLQAAAAASGRRPPEIDFYRGLLLEQKGDAADAEQALAAFAAADQASATGWYQLGLVRQSLGQDGLAEYKNAVLRSVKVAEAVMGAAGQPTAEAIATLRQDQSDAGRLQLAWLLEESGDTGGARDGYRTLFESLVAEQKVDVRRPDPIALKMALPDIMTEVPAAIPANSMYVFTADRTKLAKAWSETGSSGKVLASHPEHGWTVVQAATFDGQNDGAISKVGLKLSGELATDVLFLSVSKDGRAYYWYWNGGHLLDRYCSNPGHVGEVDYRTLRSWSGQPNVLVKACHGVPVSKLSGGHVTITDLNGLLYFYYPEMRTLRPGAWRTPSTIAKLLVRFLGAEDAPARYRDRISDFPPLEKPRAR